MCYTCDRGDSIPLVQSVRSEPLPNTPFKGAYISKRFPVLHENRWIARIMLISGVIPLVFWVYAFIHAELHIDEALQKIWLPTGPIGFIAATMYIDADIRHTDDEARRLRACTATSIKQS